jgi:uncharacterized membrane protein YcaP (DUF421 family)
MDPQDLLLTAARASAVYLFVLLVIRLLGKRSVGNFGAFDLLVALMLGEVVDEIIFGDVTMLKGFVAIAIIGLWHFVNAWAGYRSKLVDWLTESSPAVLVEDGQIKHDALARERISEQELWSELRMQSIDALEQVKRATLEPGGQVSVIQQEWARPLEKGDLPQATRAQRPAQAA